MSFAGSKPEQEGCNEWALALVTGCMRSGKLSPAALAALIVGLGCLGVCGFGGFAVYHASQMVMVEKLPQAEQAASKAVRSYTEAWDAIALFGELHPEVRRVAGKPDEDRARADQAMFGKVSAVGKPVFAGVENKVMSGQSPHILYTFTVSVKGEKATRSAIVVVREQAGRFGLQSLTWE